MLLISELIITIIEGHAIVQEVSRFFPTAPARDISRWQLGRFFFRALKFPLATVTPSTETDTICQIVTDVPRGLSLIHAQKTKKELVLNHIYFQLCNFEKHDKMCRIVLDCIGHQLLRKLYSSLWFYKHTF